MSEKSFNEIVLIADRLFAEGNEADIEGSNLEMISDLYYSDISSGLKSICKSFSHYNSPKEFIDNISQHQKSIVFTIYGGLKSINRMALIPSICEAYGVRFVGADTYGRVVCQDKFLSKKIASRAGIQTPRSILVDRLSRLEYIEELKMPVVVKPNFEGSSIGISEKSLIHDVEKVKSYSESQFQKFQQPILIEEFIEGREISVCIVGSNSKISLFETMEIRVESDDSYFDNKLYTAFEKHKSDAKVIHVNNNNSLSSETTERLKQVFKQFPKMDFMRIDGRVNESGFHFIEFTPDAYIAQNSSINDAAKSNNVSYQELLMDIINNALTYYQTPYSNCKET